MQDNSVVTWTDEAGKERAYKSMAEALTKVEPVVRASGGDIYLNVAPGNVSVRDSFDRRDYYDFRPGEATPRRAKDIIGACMQAYHAFGPVRNTIDLMSDFASQGIDIVHPNERIEKFYKEWFRKVNGPERTERFLNVFYRCGTVVVKRQTARLKPSDEERLRQARAAPDTELDRPLPIQRREVPWRYTFLNPLSLEVLAEPLAPFGGQESFQYAVRVPDAIAKIVKSPKSAAERAVVDSIPADIRDIIISGQKLVPLDRSKLSVHFYKRDDWQAWAVPMIAPLLKDLSMLEKMKLADLAALDGAISCIRVWKLGSVEAKIMPSETLIMRLAQMLNNNVGGGVMDLVWGPDIDLIETSTKVVSFLGETKYVPVLNAIFQGLGVPTTLNASAGAGSGGFSNNYMSLKTLIERLEYGRAAAKSFWQAEAEIVRRAMDFRFPPAFVFDKMLTDEAAEKALLIQLIDRDLVSPESVQDAFGFIPEIEDIRIRRAYRRRKAKEGTVPPKAGPYHRDAMFAGDVEKIFAQTGAYAPSQFGVELDEKKGGEKTPKEAEAAAAPKTPAPAPAGGVAGQGRPVGADDAAKRKTKVVKPRTTAAFLNDCLWAEDALDGVGAMTSPAYLKSLGKATMRELTEAEAAAFEAFKFGVLCQLPVGSDVCEDNVLTAVRKEIPVPREVAALVRASVAEYADANGRQPPVARVRGFQAAAYVIFCGGEEDHEGEEGGAPDDGVPALP